MIWNGRKLLMIAAVSVVCLGGCSSKDQSEPAEQEKPNDVSLFTGELITDSIDQRPILATISNIPAARPQSGLSDADQIYEFLAEGQITRYAALFQSKVPDQLGPIRSARDYFVQLAAGMDAFYVAHGYSPDAKKLLDGRVVDHINGINYDGTLFERSADRRAPHNSYISKEHIEEAFSVTNASEKITARPSFSFLNPDESDKIGDMASAVQVSYSSDPNFISTYQYNQQANRYYRSVNGIETVDKLNERRIELANIIVMEMDHQTVDQQGRLAIDLESGGPAMLFHEGIAKSIEWQNKDGFLTPMDQDMPVKLTAGKTWIHIVPSLSGPFTSVTYTP
ncbi:hypothetical protein CSV71_10990 [Sporosarcina sp. P21c]|uniref:DUF3048 domain-containing protein n=2 Tax=Sporosarcina TaxID=1569 RepID=UPI000C16CA05|nr:MULTISPECIES: DUF3048 domain-containing protein [unclassified Sporosarcina]PIC66357.1 hypothetical protein CSV78_13145 [Sporosarcina sp. P16a]PIC82646.1 hypothetical protein CSV73_11660 [Sporosarcina sp. P1]PIC89240.1 hypothetical protein CSV71_10990 [Sporosarcina sp. P21c]PIC92309.1 hypothetical protein CSV70_11450 [Sporosarcina sp. P25]